jgi:hypothetical protein
MSDLEYHDLVYISQKKFEHDYFLNNKVFEKVAFCTVATPEIEDYAKYTKYANQIYCDTQGYNFVTSSKRLGDRAPAWDKVLLAMSCIDEHDVVFCLDADAIIIDHNIRLEQFMVRDKDLYLVNDRPYRGRDFCINTGAWLMRTDTIERKNFFKYFCQKWYELGKNLSLEHQRQWEQTALNVLLYELPEFQGCFYGGPDIGRARLFPYDDINNFLYHSMTKPLNYRIEQFKKTIRRLGLEPLEKKKI